MLDETVRAEAELYGRRTYELLAARWPSRSGALADRLNSMPKYVISSTLTDPEWNNTTALDGDVAEEVSKLKREIDGEFLVLGNMQLVRALTEQDLVDELRLMVNRVVLDSGERLFGDTEAAKRMRLRESRTLDDELAYLVYERPDAHSG